jgi:uncharacterized protein (TIGR02246 family)
MTRRSAYRDKIWSLPNQSLQPHARLQPRSTGSLSSASTPNTPRERGGASACGRKKVSAVTGSDVRLHGSGRRKLEGSWTCIVATSQTCLHFRANRQAAPTWSTETMTRSRLFPPIVVLVVLVASLGYGRCAAGQGSSSPALDTAAILASARPEIDEANKAWVPGLRQRNADMIAAAYADSGLFIAPDGTVTRGRTAVTQMYTARFPRLREIRDGAVIQDGVAVVSAESVYEWGHAWLLMAAATPGGPPVRSGGAYLTVWQRQSDGHWRIVRNLAM